MIQSLQKKIGVLNATGVETPRGFRLAKEKASKQIDLAVALAMACCAALQAGKPSTNRHALTIGVGRGIGYELRKMFGSTFGQALPGSTFGPTSDEERPGRGGAWLYRFGWGNNGEQEDDYVSQTGRRRKFPSTD